MRHPLLVGAALALASTALPSLPAYAEDARSSGAVPAAADTQARGVTWTEGWSAGKAAAAESGKLMLVYIRRSSPP